MPRILKKVNGIQRQADGVPYTSSLIINLTNYDTQAFAEIEKAWDLYETRLSLFCLALCEIVKAKMVLNKHGLQWFPMQNCIMPNLPEEVYTELIKHRDKVDFTITFNETKKEFVRKIINNKQDLKF